MFLLVVVKHSAAWDTMGNLFKIKGATFGKLISGFIPKVADNFYEALVDYLVSKYTKSFVVSRRTTFSLQALFIRNLSYVPTV